METVIQELDPRKCSELVEEIARMERKIFPKHESLARSLKQDLSRKNNGFKSMPRQGVKGEETVESLRMHVAAGVFWYFDAVRESYRRQGHGEALLKAAIQKCRRVRVQRVCLHVDPERIPALSLYQKLGFQIDDQLVSKLMILLSLTILLIEMLIECTWIFDC
ncbi:hypothetical protein KSP39_PZI023848 [Platanthera zijinensis]|uniref:N-acetyltransferase domain-containing protein n=1 Tax=Platanthera zijinensis TaxID=2320716 RepID=A0AAP0ATF7_9ASPA